RSGRPRGRGMDPRASHRRRLRVPLHERGGGRPHRRHAPRGRPRDLAPRRSAPLSRQGPAAPPAALAMLAGLTGLVTSATPRPAPGGAPPAERFAIGARAGLQRIFFEGDGAPSDLRGFVFGVDPSLRLGHHFALAAAFELSLFTERSDRIAPGPT